MSESTNDDAVGRLMIVHLDEAMVDDWPFSFSLERALLMAYSHRESCLVSQCW